MKSSREGSSAAKRAAAARMMSRRRFVGSAATGAAALPAIASAGAPRAVGVAVPADYRIQRGRVKQSIMGWTFDPMPVPELARHCKEIGLVAMEGIGAQHYPAVRALGLEISLVGSHGFAKGPAHRENHAEVESKLREAIDLAARVKCGKVITFTGIVEPGFDRDTGAKNCVDCWQRVIGHAEKKGVMLCLEHLNSRDATHPMKGHPGYFGDDVDFCVELIRKVGSPNMKLLFDIYHVQIMHGDVIRRLRQHREIIAHYHTAGVPGRGELDDTQEVNYPAIIRAILETGYDGYIVQEFIPTWPDSVLALRHAAMTCDV